MPVGLLGVPAAHGPPEADRATGSVTASVDGLLRPTVPVIQAPVSVELVDRGTVTGRPESDRDCHGGRVQRAGRSAGESRRVRVVVTIIGP